MADAAASRRVTEDELAESLIFFRRRLAERIIIAYTKIGGCNSIENRRGAVEAAEDMANALCERLAARETGRAEGYRR